MAVDDIIIAMSGDNTVITYQPAAGVEAIVMCTSHDGTGSMPSINDGTNDSTIMSTGTNSQTSHGNLKLGITNAVFLSLEAMGAGTFAAYSAIQIK